MDSSSLSGLVDDLKKSQERFNAVRASTVQRLRECAARLERTGKLCKAGVIAGKATVVGGSTIVVSATATFASFGATAPCTVPLFVAGSATTAIGSLVKSGCRYTLHVKRKRRMRDIEEALRMDGEVSSHTIDDLIRTLAQSKASALIDEYSFASDVIEVAQTLLSCTPKQLMELEDLMTNISGINGLDIQPFSTNESMLLSSVPGLNELLDNLGVLEAGSSGFVEFLAELIIGDVLPLRAILLPVHILSLLRGVHRFSKKAYLASALCLRKVADELEGQGKAVSKSMDAVMMKLVVE